jgi:DNA polymerase sigma
MFQKYADNLAAKVELFGSFANTFTIANSDIDCCVTDPNSTSDELQQSGLPEVLQKYLDERGTSPPHLPLCIFSDSQVSKQPS